MRDNCELRIRQVGPSMGLILLPTVRTLSQFETGRSNLARGSQTVVPGKKNVRMKMGRDTQISEAHRNFQVSLFFLEEESPSVN